MSLPGRRFLVPALTCSAGGEESRLEVWSASEISGNMEIGFKERDNRGASKASRDQRQCLHFNRWGQGLTLPLSEME